MPDLMAMLDAGGNVAMIAVAGALWRFDRRILSLEICMKAMRDRIARGSN